ncbi:MAG TPA: PadR family transcriptional regulator [Bacteroides sp.]|nr:PadR family transcriptional regulator [Bacteroides sp.]
MIGKDLIKGMIRPIILHLLLQKERMYGYEITQVVREQTGGKIALTLGALYPVLHKLESEGILETSSQAVDNRLRKYYTLSRRGRKAAFEQTVEMYEFLDALQAFCNPPENRNA